MILKPPYAELAGLSGLPSVLDPQIQRVFFSIVRASRVSAKCFVSSVRTASSLIRLVSVLLGENPFFSSCPGILFRAS